MINPHLHLTKQDAAADSTSSAVPTATQEPPVTEEQDLLSLMDVPDPALSCRSSESENFCFSLFSGPSNPASPRLMSSPHLSERISPALTPKATPKMHVAISPPAPCLEQSRSKFKGPCETPTPTQSDVTLLCGSMEKRLGVTGALASHSIKQIHNHPEGPTKLAGMYQKFMRRKKKNKC